MKKCKNYLSFLVILLFVQQITFAQTTSPVVNTYLKADLYGKTLVHVVWENYDATNIRQIILETSSNAVEFTQLSQTLVSELVDIHLFNYPQQINYYDRILLSTENGKPRFIYNDDIKDQRYPIQKKWYRLRMITFSGSEYISQSVSIGTEINSETIDSPDFYNAASKSITTQGLTGSKAACPPIGAAPSGYLPSGITRTIQGICCTYTETNYYNPDTSLISPVPACANGNDWCCSNVPQAATCAAGYAVDYCCVHHCNDYLQCSCNWVCCQNAIDSIWVVTSATPNAPFALTATATPDSICIGEQTTLTATSSPVQPGMTFLWLPGNSSGQTVSVFPNSTVVYTVIATDSTGNCTSTVAVTVTVNQPVTPVFNMSQIICEGDSLSLPSVSNNGITGTWIPQVNNTTTTTYTFTPDPGQCASSTTTTVLVIPIPQAPTIVLNGSVLYSSALIGNQWYFNGTLIPNATGYFYDASLTGNGTYYVIVTYNNCTSDTSNFLLVNVGIEENSATIGLNIYPNPARELLTIETASTQQDKVISLLNILGQIVMQQPMAQQRSEIDVRRLSKGLYFLKLTTKNGSVVRKFVKE